jgi:aspartokinase
MREAVNDSPLVIKFGGTSVGGGAAFSRAASIAAEAARGRPVAVVVSAMSGVTNLLLGHASGVVDPDGRRPKNCGRRSQRGTCARSGRPSPPSGERRSRSGYRSFWTSSSRR